MKNNNSKKARISLNAMLFFVSYAIFLVTNILNASFYAKYLNGSMVYIMVSCVAIIIMKELFCSKLGKREIILLLICSLLSLIIFLHPNSYSMFPLFFLLYGARGSSFEKIAKFTIIVSSILLGFIFISAKTGIITDYVSYSNGRVRDYLGFRYALFPAALSFNVTALVVYLDKSHRIKKYLLLLIMNLIIFKYTNSRLSFYLSVLLIACSYLAKIKPVLFDRMKLSKFLLIFSFIICSTVSFMTIAKYDESNKIMHNANTILENRLSLGKTSLKEYPVSIFGQSVEYSGSGLSINGRKSKKDYNYVDCLYLNLLEKYGIVFYVFFIALMTYSVKKISNKKEYVLLIIMATIAARGMIDDLGIYLYYNTFWFVISRSIIMNGLKKSIRKKGENNEGV